MYILSAMMSYCLCLLLSKTLPSSRQADDHAWLSSEREAGGTPKEFHHTKWHFWTMEKMVYAEDSSGGKKVPR